jgi:arylsulfatase A-like enzyme
MPRLGLGFRYDADVVASGPERLDASTKPDGMKRRLDRWIRAIAWAIAVFAASSPSAATSRTRPNVLFISLDTVRADFLTFRDSEATPHMTALARDGAIFTQAVSGTSWTLPAHVQMFTGTPPVLHRVQSDDVRIDPRMPTLPEVLRDAGYYTAGFFTNAYLSGFYGFERGFDVYDTPFNNADNTDQADADDPDSGLEAAPPQGREARAQTPQPIEERFITSPKLVALARRALESANPADPVFLFAHFFDPHYDFIPPAPWDTKFDPDYAGDIDGHNYYWNKRIFDESKQPQRQIGDRDLEHIRSLYRGEIGWTDQSVGDLLKLFEQYQRLDNTLIVIASDHGEEFFEHSRHGHRKSLYEEVLRVPLLIVPPKDLRSGLSPVVSQQASLSDLLPTVMDFAGVATPRTATGRSLRPAMYGATLTDRAELSSLHTWQRRDGRFHHWFLHGLRTTTFKFIRLTEVDTEGTPRVGSFAYYDLGEDPEERHGITTASDARVLAAWRQLESELDKVRQSWKAQPRSRQEERIIRVEFKWSEELVALGYARPGEAVMQSPLAFLASGLEPMARIDPPEPALVPWRKVSLAAGSILVLALLVLLRRRSRSRTTG